MRKHLTIQVEREDFKRIKVDVLTLSIIIAGLSVIGALLLAVNWVVAGFIVLIGVVAYVLALTFSVQMVVETQVKRLKDRKKVRKVVDLSFLLLMGFILFTIIQSVIALNGFINVSSNEQKVYGLLSLVILVFSVTSWNLLHGFVRKNYGKSRLLLVFLPVIMVFFLSQANITGAFTLNETEQAVETVSMIGTVIDTIGNITSFISEQQGVIVDALGLNETQSAMLMGIVLLVAILLVAKFIESIIKWLVLILIGVFLIMLI